MILRESFERFAHHVVFAGIAQLAVVALAIVHEAVEIPQDRFLAHDDLAATEGDERRRVGRLVGDIGDGEHRELLPVVLEGAQEFG